MASFEYNPIASYISLRFKCPTCSTDNETDAMGVPSPDFTAETSHDSTNSEEYFHYCPECGEEFRIDLYTSFYDGYGEINIDNDVNLFVEEEFEEEDYDYTPDVNEYLAQTKNALEEIGSLSQENQDILLRVLYANAISCMEGYLYSRLLSWVLSSDKNKRFFVEHFYDSQQQKIALSECYKVIDGIDSRIKNLLKDVIWHNLDRVSKIYKSVGVDIGEIEDLLKCVDIRHDIVHRNGKDKEGNLHKITRDNVDELIIQVSNFIDSIEQQFLKMS